MDDLLRFRVALELAAESSSHYQKPAIMKAIMLLKQIANSVEQDDEGMDFIVIPSDTELWNELAEFRN